jgi:hypothetical protein
MNYLSPMKNAMAKDRLFATAVLNTCVSICLLLHNTSSRASSPSPPTDHLLPLGDGEIEDSYKEVLRRKLFVTAADYARITLLYGGVEGERSFAIHSDRSSPTGVFMTCTQSAANLGTATWDLNPQRIDEAQISVRKTAVPMPKGVAEEISRAVKQAISDARRREMSNPAQGTIFDGTRIIFATGKASQEAILTPECQGGHMVMLRNLVEQMEDYCKNRSNRGRVGQTMETTAKQIVEWSGKSR